MTTPSLTERIRRAQSVPDPTGSPDFELLRGARKTFSRGGRTVPHTPENDARMVVFDVLRALLESLAEFSRRVQRGERLRLRVTRHHATPGKVALQIEIQPDNSAESKGP